MPILLISYDLADARSSPALTAAIKTRATRWARPLASTMLIETDLSPTEIETHVAPLLGIDDGLIIQQTAGMPALSNAVVRWSEAGTRGQGPDADVVRLHRSRVAEAA